MGSASLKETKHVSFTPFVAVRNVMPLKDADLWYRKRDYQAMKEEVRRTVHHYKTKRNGRATEKGGLCTRGLEEYLVKNPQIARERRMKTALIVLLENDRQLDEEGNTVDNEKLASCLKGISLKSTETARRRALHDDAVIKRKRNRGNTCHLASAQIRSPTHKSLDCTTATDIEEQKDVFQGASLSILATTINTHHSARLNILRLRELSRDYWPANSPDRSVTSGLFVPGSPHSRSTAAVLPFRAPSRSPLL